MRHHKQLLQLELDATSTEELLAQYKKVEAIITDIEESVNKQTDGQHGLRGDVARTSKLDHVEPIIYLRITQKSN